MHLYITESDVKVGISQGSVVVARKGNDAETKTYPIGKLEAVSIFGKPTLSTVFMREMLMRNISVGFYSGDAHYYGRLVNPDHTSAPKQRLQAIMGLDDKFCLEISKRIVCAKLTNQLNLLRAFVPNLGMMEIELFENSIQAVRAAKSKGSIMGFEGTAAKNYFQLIATLLPEEFKFKTRSTRPPLDPFNSMVSLGYSMLYRNVLGAIEQHGMNSYFGVMHEDREKHAALASDLMEEWRAVIVDDTVLQMIITGEISADEFEKSPKNGGCYASKEAIRKVVKAFSRKMLIAQEYLGYDTKNYSFQHALDLQLYRFYRALENDDPSYYQPVSLLEEFQPSEDEFRRLESASSGFSSGDAAFEDDMHNTTVDVSRGGDIKEKVWQNAHNACSKAIKGELHTTMIASIGRLINAKFQSTEINAFIDEFCALWGDNDVQRNGYYYAAEQFMLAREKEQPLAAPFIPEEGVAVLNRVEDLVEPDANAHVPLLLHTNVRSSRGEKVLVAYEKLQEYEYALRPKVSSWEEGQARKASGGQACITFGEFDFNTRKNMNARGRNVMLLDYDEDVDGAAFSDARMREILGIAKAASPNVLLLESISSKQGARKFHLLFLTRMLNAKEYTEAFRVFDEKMMQGCGVRSDKSCKDIARTMYVGVRYAQGQ